MRASSAAPSTTRWSATPWTTSCAADWAADALNGQGGFDWADYQKAAAAVTANLTTPASNTGEATGDTYTSIEGIVGSAFNDALVGNAVDNFLRGGLGSDALNGQGGFDWADYQKAAVAVTANLTTPASNTGEATGDTYTSIEGIVGSAFNDTLVGNAVENFLRGGTRRRFARWSRRLRLGGLPKSGHRRHG